MDFEVTLGKMYRDSVSGFVGTAVTRVTYLTGSPRIGLQAMVDEDGKLPGEEWFGESQLVDASEA